MRPDRTEALPTAKQAGKGPGGTYPRRPSYFAHRYTRLLTKTCAAQEIGHLAFTLCVTIAHQEDAKRYKGPVTYFNEQLMPLVGVAKWDTLDHARTRAVNAGWLHYEPGNRGLRMPGRYWVTIPEALQDLGDAPCDESQSPENGEWVESQSPTQYPANGDREGERQGDREGEHSTLALFPNPDPKKRAPACAGSPPAGLLELIDGWNALDGAIVARGNRARRDPPSKELLEAWGRATKNPDQREALKDIPSLLAAIRRAEFCHGQGWFTLAWLFGRNKNRELNLCRLLSGAHNEKGDRHASARSANQTGPGQRDPADTAARSRPGVF